MNKAIEVQMIRNQQVILLAMKKLLPEEWGHDVVGVERCEKDSYLVQAIDECLKNSRDFEYVVNLEDVEDYG